MLSRLLALSLIAVSCPAITTDWIQELGGTFRKDRQGRIVEVDLTLTQVTDDDLAKLAEIPTLQKITLAHAKISDLGLAQLRPLKNVTYLNCYYCDYITDGGIAYIRDWTNLETLIVRGSEVTSRVFEHLAKMKKLKSLDVGFSRVNDDGFDALSALESLEDLHIGGDKMSGLALPLLRLLPSLKHLDVNGSQRTDSGRWGLMLTDVNFESLTALTKLESLNMGGASVSDAGMSQIVSLANLTTLDLSRMDLTAKGIEPVSKLPKLRRLNLWQSPRIDDKAMALIASMKTLEILDLSETSVTDSALDRLAQMKQLKAVFLDGSKVTSAGAYKLRRALPGCRVVWAPKYREVKSEEDTRLTG